jgi:DNA-binding CsgD family transcriptional regulator
VETAFPSLLERLAAPALIVDRAGVIDAANDAADVATRRTLGELRGRDFLELVPTNLQVPTGAALERALGDGETTECASALVRGSDHVECRMLFVPLRFGVDSTGALTVLHDLRHDGSSADRPKLTPRQHEILALLGAARTTSEIAAELHLSVETVRNHIRAVLAALDARSRLEAVVRAERLGLIPPGPGQTRSGTGPRR